MECLIHSPAFNTVQMAWVAGVGGAVPLGHLHGGRVGLRPRAPRRAELHLVVPQRHHVQVHVVGGRLPPAHLDEQRFLFNALILGRPNI